RRDVHADGGAGGLPGERAGARAALPGGHSGVCGGGQGAPVGLHLAVKAGAAIAAPCAGGLETGLPRGGGGRWEETAGPGGRRPRLRARRFAGFNPAGTGPANDERDERQEMSAKQRARRGMKSLSLHEVDREKFQLFTKRRQGWVNVL